jgi:hypothetical protein
MQEIGGDYLGSLKHPSWNGYYGNNSIVLFRELRKFGCECRGDCNVCNSINEMGDCNMCNSVTETPCTLATNEKIVEEAKPFDGSCLDYFEEAPQMGDSVLDEAEEVQLFLDGSSYNSDRVFSTFRESGRTIAALLTDESVELSVADLLTLPMEEGILGQVDSHSSDTSIPANIASFLIDEEDAHSLS